MPIMPPPDPSFGPRLTKLREARGLNQKELTARLRWPLGVVSKLERAVRDPRGPEIVQLSAGLGVTAAELLGLPDGSEVVDPGISVRVRMLCERIAPDRVPALFALLDAALGLTAGFADAAGTTGIAGTAVEAP